MAEPTPTNCRSCRARVVFMLTKNDKLAPFDYPPRPCPMCGGAGCAKCQDGKLWVSHFGTCPTAAQHRKARR